MQEYAWLIQVTNLLNTLPFYNFALILTYIYLYVFSILLVFTFEFLNLSTLAKILNKYPTHIRVVWLLFLLVLAGTPPFLIFFSKVFFISLLMTSKAWGLVFLLLSTNIILFYVYLQNLVFLKKTTNTSFASYILPKHTHLDLYLIQLLYIYLNMIAVFVFPLLLGSV